MAEGLQVGAFTASKATILIVSVPDYQQFALCGYAEYEGYHPITVGDLSDFDWRMPPDLIVCEHREPQIDATKVCRYIRLHSDVPVLAVISTGTAKALPSILDAGADMCLAAPYDADQFGASLRAMFRRTRKHSNAIQALEVGDFHVLREAQRCTVKGKEIRLSSQEFRLLSYLVQHPYRILSHAELLHAIWGDGCTYKAEYLRPLVMSLRKRLEQDWQSPDYIRTAHKGGYLFVPSAEPGNNHIRRY